MRRRTRSAFFGVKMESGESDHAAHEPSKDPAADTRQRTQSAFFDVKTELEEMDAATRDLKKAPAVSPGPAGASPSGRVGTRRATGWSNPPSNSFRRDGAGRFTLYHRV